MADSVGSDNQEENDSRWQRGAFAMGQAIAVRTDNAGMDRQTLRDWVIRFNVQGPDGLVNIPSPGAPSKLRRYVDHCCYSRLMLVLPCSPRSSSEDLRHRARQSAPLDAPDLAAQWPVRTRWRALSSRPRSTTADRRSSPRGAPRARPVQRRHRRPCSEPTRDRKSVV